MMGCLAGATRRILLVAMAITILTNLFEYGFEEPLGGFLFWRFRSPALDHLSLRLMESHWLKPVINLPMTLAAFAVLAGGAWLLIPRFRRAG